LYLWAAVGPTVTVEGEAYVRYGVEEAT